LHRIGKLLADDNQFVKYALNNVKPQLTDIRDRYAQIKNR